MSFKPMKETPVKVFCGMILAFLVCVMPSSAQEPHQARVEVPVSYVAASTIYLEAGTDLGIAVGDSVVVMHGDTVLARCAITAVAARSASARYSAPGLMGKQKLTAVISLTPQARSAEPQGGREVSSDGPDSTQIARRASELRSGENVLTGRVSAGFNGSFAENSKLNLAQPFADVRMSMKNIAGTAWNIDLNNHFALDLKDDYAKYNNSKGAANRLFRLSASHVRPDDPYGINVGRTTSLMVPSMGTFDGAEVFGRAAGITLGVAGGHDATAEMITGSTKAQKLGVFGAYTTGPDMLHKYDGSLAYIRESEGGTLQRVYAAVSNNLSLGPEWFILQSAELDLQSISSGSVQNGMTLSNVFAFVQYAPTTAMNFSLGYDAVRQVYPLGMAAVLVDSLMDRNLEHSLRGNATVRLLEDLTMYAYGGFSARGGGVKSGTLLGVSLRNRNLFHWKMNGSVKLDFNTGPFATVKTYTVQADKPIGRLDASVSASMQKITIDQLMQSYSSYRGTVSLSYVFPQGYFVSMSGDGRLDDTMNGVRFFLEAGLRF
jgi:hypothetical protein